MLDLLDAASLLFVLLNPFLMSIYLLAIIRELPLRQFSSVLLRAHVISAVVFCIFAIVGESIFETVFQVSFAAFLVFGGLIFLMIGVQSVFKGPSVLFATRGDPEHVVGAIAMPFMIAPGTLSASVLIGAGKSPIAASGAVLLALSATLVSIILFKYLHDTLQKRNERILNRYVDIVGRVVALFTGTFAIEMIAKGGAMLVQQYFNSPV